MQKPPSQQAIHDINTYGDQQGKETPVASIVDKIPIEPLGSTQPEKSKEVTWAHKEVVVYSTSSNNPNDMATINYLTSVVVTKDRT